MSDVIDHGRRVHEDRHSYDASHGSAVSRSFAQERNADFGGRRAGCCPETSSIMSAAAATFFIRADCRPLRLPRKEGGTSTVIR